MKTKKLVLPITIALAAVAVAAGIIIYIQSTKIPADAVLGGIEGTLVEIENQIAIRMQADEDGNALKEPLPKTMYIFEPDGRLIIATENMENGEFIACKPLHIYFVKGNVIYYCTTMRKEGEKVPAYKNWKVTKKFKLVDGKPYIDSSFTEAGDDILLKIDESEMTWDEFMTQVRERM